MGIRSIADLGTRKWISSPVSNQAPFTSKIGKNSEGSGFWLNGPVGDLLSISVYDGLLKLVGR
jgi:hypothetical protein